MRLYYYKDRRGNFGDDLNPWLWPRIVPGLIDPPNVVSDELFIGFGTLLNERVPEIPKRKVVLGAGVGYGRGLPSLTEDWRVLGVRGPRSAAALGLPAEASVTDGAVLIREVVPPRQSVTGGVALMLHHITVESGDWRSVSAEMGMQFLDPADSVDRTIESIRSARLLVTEAMHGAIVADALRVPWIPIRTSDHILDDKWHDWCESLGMKHRAVPLSGVWPLPQTASPIARARSFLKRSLVEARLRWIVRFERPRLSADATFDAVYARIREKLAQLRSLVHFRVGPSAPGVLATEQSVRSPSLFGGA